MILFIPRQLYLETSRIDFSFANCDRSRTIQRLLDDDVATGWRGCTAVDGHSRSCWSCRRVLPTQRILTSHRCTNQWRSIRYSDDEIVQAILWKANNKHTYKKIPTLGPEHGRLRSDAARCDLRSDAAPH